MSEPDFVLAMLAAMLPGLSQINTADLYGIQRKTSECCVFDHSQLQEESGE